jgi:molybdopterin/thiamine biosynthesis adenylyltransferase
MAQPTVAGAAAPEISEAEAALYDRQIRLWGVEAQRRFVVSTAKTTAKKASECGRGVSIEGKQLPRVEKIVRNFCNELSGFGTFRTVHCRLRGSHVLVVHLNGLTAEVCKNIVLAGIGTLNIVDDKTVEPIDLAANFFLTAPDVGRNARSTIASFQSRSLVY